MDDLKRTISTWVAHVTAPGGMQVQLSADPNNPADVASARATLAALVGANAHAAVAPPVAAQPIGPWPPAPVVSYGAKLLPPLPFAKCLELWAAAEGAAWKPKTAVTFTHAAKEFLKYVQKEGVQTLAQVSRAHCAAYKAHLALKLAPKTINKRFSGISSLFRWAQAAGQWPQDMPLPTAGHFYTKTQLRSASAPWSPFTLDQMRVVFESSRWRKHRTAHEYWVPLLCLHLGLRVSEASQLATDNFFQEGALWCVSVDARTGGRNLKTPWSGRQLPLPPALLALNILDYLEDVRAVLGGDGMLFPYLPFDKDDGYGTIPGRQFIRHLERCLDNREGLVTHSLRKTASIVLQNKVADTTRDQFLGHEGESITAIHYSMTLSLPELHATIGHLLKFPIDYTALAYRRGEFVDLLRRDIRRWGRKRRKAR